MAGEWKQKVISEYQQKAATQRSQAEEAKRQIGIQLGPILTKLLGVPVEAQSDRVTVDGIQFAGRTGRAGAIVPWFVSICPYCEKEQLSEIHDRAELGMYLEGTIWLHDCSQAQKAVNKKEVAQGEDAPEKKLVSALRELLGR